MASEQGYGFLIIEDEALLAMDIACLVEDRGHHVIAEAASPSEVAALPCDRAVHCALVDIQLLDGTSGLDAAAVVLKGWPDATILFVTANPGHVTPGFPRALGIVQKPFTRQSLGTAIDYMAATLRPADVTPDWPAGLLPVPAID